MELRLINKETLSIYIADYSYVSKSNQFVSRCSEGNYKNDETLPMLALPGGDIGQLVILQATANVYGFDFHLEKAANTLLEVIGDKGNFSSHGGFSHCGYLKHLIKSPELFSLEKDQLETIKAQVSSFPSSNKSVGSVGQTVAVVQIKGSKGLYPQFTVRSEEGAASASIFMFHQTLIDKRHRALAAKMVTGGAVTLYNDLDAEYLYEVLSSTTEDHIFEITRVLAKGLPIYEVQFAQDGGFSLEERGFV